jgi:hypothetical protein
MFDEAVLTEAVEIQQRCYRLLLWVADATQRGFVPITRAHEYTSDREAAEDWLSEHFLNLPLDCRPTERTGPALRQFARFFASYLRTSFELEAYPGNRLVSSRGCYCTFCSHLVAASNLRAKKLTSRDKHRAQRIKRKYLEGLLYGSARPVDKRRLDLILSDGELSRLTALAAYGKELLYRCQGQGQSGPAVLALWREFAWLPTGSPIPRFELQAQDIIHAERVLNETLLR